MKILPEHYKHMESAIASIAGQIPFIVKSVRTDGKYKDFDKRVRWDIWYHAGLTKFACDVLYQYCDDTHIDTALRKIVSNYMTE